MKLHCHVQLNDNYTNEFVIPEIILGNQLQVYTVLANVRSKSLTQTNAYMHSKLCTKTYILSSFGLMACVHN